jgi:hypothetical protein
MTDSDLPIIDNTVAQLFRASHYSLDPATADFMLRRVVPITIYIDGDYEGLTDVANDLRTEITRIMAEIGYPQVGEWGPFYGSHLTTIFGQGAEWESGPSVLRHLRDLSGQLLRLKERVPPEAAAGIRIVLVVGAFVVHLAGPAAIAAVLPVTVPVVVIEYVALAVGAGESIEAIRHALELKPFGRRPFPKRAGKFEF